MKGRDGEGVDSRGGGREFQDQFFQRHAEIGGSEIGHAVIDRGVAEARTVLAVSSAGSG